MSILVRIVRGRVRFQVFALSIIIGVFYENATVPDSGASVFSIGFEKIREKREKDLFFTLVFVIIKVLMIQFETVFCFSFNLVINKII